MQLGFAMLEVGSVRKAHSMTVLAKNVLDSTVSMIGFWLFCEMKTSKLTSDADGNIQSQLVLFHSAFCGTAVTICSGSMAERCHMNAYLCFAVLMSLVIYPQVAEGAWTQGSLLSGMFHDKFGNGYDYHDFAGSGVVHMTGGCCALVGNAFLGRRIMKKRDSGFTTPSSSFSGRPTDPVADPGRLSHLLQRLEDPRYGSQVDASPGAPMDGSAREPDHQQQGNAMLPSEWPRRYDHAERDEHEFSSSSSYLQVMGMFTLWVGWYGFNAGSTLSVAGLGSTVAGIVAMNTTLAACAGGLGSYAYCYYMMQHLDLGIICNGVLSGLIAITASCAITTRVVSAISGFFVGLILYPLLHNFTKLLKLDDPVDAIPVHAGSGLFGVLVVAFCRPDCAAFDGNFGDFEALAHFCKDDYSLLKQLGAQAFGALTISIWSVCFSVLVWGLPALSECTIALEDGYLEQVASILFSKALAPASEDQQLVNDPNLVDALLQSDMATKILKQHGWIDNHFAKLEHSEPPHLLEICRHIKSEQNNKTKTALEIIHWRSFSYFSTLLRRCKLNRCCACRLRILPAAELTGLGTTATEGGWILQKVRRLVQSLDKEAASAQKNTSDSLQQEVRELHALVHGQEALLRSLRRHPQRMPQIRDAENDDAPSSVSSRSSRRGTSLGRSLERVNSPEFERSAAGGGQPYDEQLYTSSAESRSRREHLLRAPRSLHTSSGGRSSASTRSDHSMGAISQRSMEFTPPPSMLGRGHHSRHPRDAHRDAENFNTVARQLAEVLERQQQLLTSWQAAPTPPLLAAHQAAPPQQPVVTPLVADTNGHLPAAEKSDSAAVLGSV